MLVVGMLVQSICYANENKLNELGFTSIGELEIKSDIFQHALRANYIWDLEKKNGELSFQKYTFKDYYEMKEKKVPEYLKSLHSRSNITALEMLDGYLVSYNRGEFGGEVRWISRDKGQDYKITDSNINVLYKIDEHRVLALEGLSHLLSTEGGIIWFGNNDFEKNWKVVKTIDLDAEPTAMLKTNDGAYLIVVGNELIRLSDDYKITQIHESIWKSLRPKSIVLSDSGDIYLGMKFFVLRLRRDGGKYKETWFYTYPEKRVSPVESN
jgi:hypothetical protein